MSSSIDKYNLKMSLLLEAKAKNDWEKVASLIILNPDIMEDALNDVYPCLPDAYKFSIPTHCYTHNGDRMPGIRRYVRQARKYAPLKDRIPAEMAARPKIEVYRAGAEPISRAAYCISWTTSLDVAKWFYGRAITLHRPSCHLYKGFIMTEKIICFSNDRQGHAARRGQGYCGDSKIEKGFLSGDRAGV